MGGEWVHVAASVLEWRLSCGMWSTMSGGVINHNTVQGDVGAVVGLLIQQ